MSSDPVSLQFNQQIQESTKELHELKEQMNVLLEEHYRMENASFPLEWKETEEEVGMRSTSMNRECIRLEELLTRVQLQLDAVKLPRVPSRDGGNYIPDPVARQTRKEIVQAAEDCIQKLQKIRFRTTESKL